MTYRLELVEELATLQQNEDIILHWLKVALSKAPENNIETVLAGIIKGDYLLWLAKKEDEIVGVVTTEVLQHPEYMVMCIELLGGMDIKEWVDTISTIENQAKGFGCKSIEIYGRPAWKKLLPEYKTERIILTKELN